MHQLDQYLGHLFSRLAVFWQYLMKGKGQSSMKNGKMQLKEIAKLSRSEDAPTKQRKQRILQTVRQSMISSAD
jgi:hypothetical protein